MTIASAWLGGAAGVLRPKIRLKKLKHNLVASPMGGKRAINTRENIAVRVPTQHRVESFGPKNRFGEGLGSLGWVVTETRAIVR
jgi:hypothetical protein